MVNFNEIFTPEVIEDLNDKRIINIDKTKVPDDNTLKRDIINIKDKVNETINTMNILIQSLKVNGIIPSDL